MLKNKRSQTALRINLVRGLEQVKTREANRSHGFARQLGLKLFWFGAGMALGTITLSLSMAAVPARGKVTRVTDDTVIYQSLSEIKVPREKNPDFDSDITKLSSEERNYKENLPPRLRNAIKRVSEKKYRYSGTSKKKRTASHSRIHNRRVNSN